MLGDAAVPLLVLVSGAGGSGKTTLAKELAARLDVFHLGNAQAPRYGVTASSLDCLWVWSAGRAATPGVTSHAVRVLPNPAQVSGNLGSRKVCCRRAARCLVRCCRCRGGRRSRCLRWRRMRRRRRRGRVSRRLARGRAGAGRAGGLGSVSGEWEEAVSDAGRSVGAGVQVQLSVAQVPV